MTKTTMEEKLSVEYVVTQVSNWMFMNKRVSLSPEAYIKIQNILIKEIRQTNDH